MADTTFADLLDDIEAIPGLDGWQRAEALAALAEDGDLRDLLVQAAYRLLELRYRRGFGPWAPKGVTKDGQDTASFVSRPDDRWASGGAVSNPVGNDAATPASHTARTARTTRPGNRRHASPKQLAAGMAWRELLASQITLPGVGKVQVQDMNPGQLTQTADALFDISEQLHDLARAVTAAGVDTARALPDDTLTAIGAAAGQVTS